jgi:peptidoglycan-associated lipoprotein
MGNPNLNNLILKGIIMTTILSKSISLMAATLLVSACSTPIKMDEKAPVAEASASSANTTDTRSVHTASTEIDPLSDPKGALANRSVYFDFDKYDVKEEFNPMLSVHANYLISNKGRQVLVQGNTDERGGQEYNLALGQKRAVAVTKSLAALGVPTSQMEAVSLGKEKPKASGHDEADWAENRRADIVY